MKADLAKAFCATNMLTRQCLRHKERLSLDRFYRDRVFVVSRDFRQAADQYLCAAVLRPGNVTAAAGAAGILRRLMALIRGSFPKARIRVRLDGGFANPELLAFLDGERGVEYVVAMVGNAGLNRKAEEGMQVARLLAGLTDRTEHVYGEARYAAGSTQDDPRLFAALPVKGLHPLFTVI